MVRFVTYHTVYFQGPEFAQGIKPDWKPIVKLYAEYAKALAKYERGGDRRRAAQAGQPRVQQHRGLDRAVDDERHAVRGDRADPALQPQRPSSR